MKINKYILPLLVFCVIFSICVFANDNVNNNKNNNLDIVEEHKKNGDNFEKIISDLVKDQPSDRFVDNVELQFLDKITGKTSLSKTKIGKVLKFERLIVKPILCWKSYPEENPENKLLVKIYEVRGKNKKLLFYGWIFSSTPSISGLEHQFYDVVLKNCFNKDNI